MGEADASATSCVAVVHTAPAPGAIAVIELIGDVDGVLAALTGRDDWPRERPVLANLADVDAGIVVRLRPDVAYVMPHGGPRVLEQVLAALAQCGAPTVTDAAIDPRELFPAAGDRFEALALMAISRAASPLAIDLLLAQPERWRAHPALTPADEARSARLNRLLVPPLVVLAGPPNVGKSTLSNRLFGRRVSIAYDQPGTTRDYTAGLIDLAGLVVRWHDTPGLDDTEDPIEQRAIEIASDLLKRADYVIAITDADHDWPKLDRTPDLRVAARTDLSARADADLSTSGKTGEGIEALVETVRDALVPPEDRSHGGSWRFDARL